MKRLDDFRLVREFLGSEGIQPTVAMVGLDDSSWGDLVILASEWRDKLDAAAALKQKELDGLSEDEIAMRERAAEEERRLEDKRILFHSSGYRPEK
jgi:hypothetical protein